MTSAPVPAPGDPFAGQATAPDDLAEIYDLEHDPVTEDLAFYRGIARRVRGAVLDLGCGSGRLFGAYLDGRASRVVGVDVGLVLRRLLLRLRAAANQQRGAGQRQGSLTIRTDTRLAAETIEHEGSLLLRIIPISIAADNHSQ